MKTTPWSKIKNKFSPEKIKEIKEVARKEAKEMATKTLQVTKEVTIGDFLYELLIDALKQRNLEVCKISDKDIGFNRINLPKPLCEEVAEKFYKECEKNLREESGSGPPSWQR